MINRMESLLRSFLRSQLVGVAALPLSAVGSLGGESSVALSADLLITVVCLGKSGSVGLHGSSSQSEHQMESAFLLDVVVREGSSIFQLLSSEDESLLIRRDSFLILNLGLHVFNGVTAFNIKSDGLPGQGLHEYLHY